MIRKCARENNLKGAMSIFNSLKEAGVELNSSIYNTVLDACVKCRIGKAELLAKKLQQLQDKYRVVIKAAILATVSSKLMAMPGTWVESGAAGRRCGAGSSSQRASRSAA